ncbi:MAG: polysaccharide pyruvyl transferase family protein [Oscillospiraceae bacterium]|nr:polysaccharide pyruvyl transferase family protein [Oscillospiraceae bacterium]
MKIRIITIHGIPNFGSVFQSYALCEYLRSQGYDDVRIIDYNPKYYTSKSFRATIGRIINYGDYNRRTRKFREFIEKNLPLTEKSFTEFDELKQCDFSADVYIAGGDQLWNVYHPCGNDDAYKLTWTAGKKISYGTSLGQTGFTDKQIRELVSKISDFTAISVRESASVKMLRDAGIESSHCVDPVYLIDSEKYHSFLKPVNQPPYLLVYLITPSEILNNTIKLLSEKYGLKVILCSGFSKKCVCDEFLKDLGPDEILSYIYNAEIVLSSSFHATSFSLIFQKQFFTILPDMHTNERILDLLSHRGLMHRIITDEEQLYDVYDTHIDYSTLKPYGAMIDASKEYLKGALNNV